MTQAPHERFDEPIELRNIKQGLVKGNAVKINRRHRRKNSTEGTLFLITI